MRSNILRFIYINNSLIKYKLSPWVSGVMEGFQGKDFVSRQPKSLPRTFIERLFPITFVNLYDNFANRDQGGVETFTEFAAEFLGISVYTKEDRKLKMR